ncbi:MAG TPA: DedA family protein/thiosulfate sulfurtransferase GlpE, partial [Verrucomicrobiae bacterium]|nr:DedA family protein/thiosulfate sulfurtransferase GlpE [Verrucomicrobiae bacterium]
PLPALPWLLVAGALSATGQFNPLLAVGLTVAACLPADAVWFFLGRRRGNQVLHLLCRISLEPDSCVRRTQNIFFRHGMRGVIAAKFLPGFGTMIPPLAGMSGVSAPRFLMMDALGSFIYGTVFVAVGFVFSPQIEQITAALSRIGGNAVLLLIGLATAYIAFKVWRRQRLLRQLRMSRITVAELRQKKAAGEDLFILDLRTRQELEQDPAVIDGAIHIEVAELDTRLDEIPRDRDVILYCSCPNEITSARVALSLHRKGITRVRPLLGGIDEWRKLNITVAEKSRLTNIV